MKHDRIIDLVSEQIVLKFDDEILDRIKCNDKVSILEVYDLVIPQINDPRVKGFYAQALNRLRQIGCSAIQEVYKDWVLYDIKTHKFCKYFIAVFNNILRGLELPELSEDSD